MKLYDYVSEAMALNEMAITRSEAIDKCYSFGKQFIEHFHKIMSEGKSADEFKHHCKEMQNFYDYVKQITLKQNNKKLPIDYLINWFFTIGSNVDEVIKEPYVDIYEQLMIRLLQDRMNSKVFDILNELL